MLRKILVRLALVVMTGVLFMQGRQVALRVEPQDFTAFWTAARLATENPYSHEKVLSLDHTLGFQRQTPFLMCNPPWTLPLVLPLRYFSYYDAFAIWMLTSIIVVAAGTLLLWRFYGGKISPAALLLAMAFAPVLSMLRVGQLTAWPFLGICLFLINVERRRDWVAGTSLLLVLFKPHLFLPFFACLGCWILWSRRYRVLGGMAAALGVASTIAIAVNHHIFSFYTEAMADFTKAEQAPTLSVFLQFFSGSVLLALAPVVAAIAWAIYHWWNLRERWEWRAQLPVLLLASLVSSYYMLLYDEVVLLAALVPVAVMGGRRFWILFATVNAACLAYLLGSPEWMPKAATWSLSFWSASGWCVVYLLTSRPASSWQPAVAPEYLCPPQSPARKT
jgi:hypothetical protein